MVSEPQPEAFAVSLDVLDAGGNVIDAAVTLHEIGEVLKNSGLAPTRPTMAGRMGSDAVGKRQILAYLAAFRSRTMLPTSTPDSCAWCASAMRSSG